ncbi:ATP-dependent nuclease subunit B, partial [human gut metagenome]
GERFAYLFDRSRREVREIVADVGRELRNSDFQPVDTELSFMRGGALPPVEVLGQKGNSLITGFVDRVDLLDAGNAAYYRVIDYKTGRKEFDYASILEGEGLQMLIYLFALRKYGAQRYGKPLIPAGVLYVPSRSDMERVDPGESPEDIQALRQKKKRRKGLVLADDACFSRWSTAKRPNICPCRSKRAA